MEELVDATIYKIWIDKEEQHYLQFLTSRGMFNFYAEGDCCSESWFYAVMGVQNLLGHTVKKVELIYMDDLPDNYSRQEIDALYALNITTTGGWCGIEFRNSSNGYYGGWVVLLPGDHKIPNQMEEIDTDYIAQIGEI